MEKRHRILTLVALGIVAPAAALAQNSIDSVSVSVPACEGLDGRLSVAFTIDDQPDRWLSVVGAPVSNNVAIIYGPGSSMDDFQYVPPAGTMAGDPIAATVVLGTDAFLADLDSETIVFDCSTGALIDPPVAADDAVMTQDDTPVDIDVLANDSGALDPATVFVTSATSLGDVAMNPDGTLTYTPDPGASGVDTFDYEVCDIGGRCDSAMVSVTIELVNEPPDCDAALPSPAVLWPPNHEFVPIDILGVTDPDGDDVSITIWAITSDEDVRGRGRGSGNTEPDWLGVGTPQAQLRAEREGRGDGRVYTILFEADDGNGGACMGAVEVLVPHDQRGRARGPGPGSSSPVIGSDDGDDHGPPGRGRGGRGGRRGRSR